MQEGLSDPNAYGDAHGHSDTDAITDVCPDFHLPVAALGLRCNWPRARAGDRQIR